MCVIRTDQCDSHLTVCPRDHTSIRPSVHVIAMTSSRVHRLCSRLTSLLERPLFSLARMLRHTSVARSVCVPRHWCPLLDQWMRLYGEALLLAPFSPTRFHSRCGCTLPLSPSTCRPRACCVYLRGSVAVPCAVLWRCVSLAASMRLPARSQQWMSRARLHLLAPPSLPPHPSRKPTHTHTRSRDTRSRYTYRPPYARREGVRC